MVTYNVLMAKVVISSSSSLSTEIEDWKSKWEEKGHEIIASPKRLGGNIEAEYPAHFKNYISAINRADTLFVINVNRNNIDGYIGAGVFAEIAYAVGLNQTQTKQIEIILLNHTHEKSPWFDEINLWIKLGWIKVFDSIPD